MLFRNYFSLDIKYIDDYGKIHNDFLIFVNEKNSLKYNRFFDCGQPLNMLTVIVKWLGPHVVAMVILVTSNFVFSK